jgi:DNA-binding MarR family transcriptional regulator
MPTTTTVDFGVLLHLAFGEFKTQLHRHLAEAGFDDLGTSFGYVFRQLAEQPAQLRDVAQQLGITPQGALKVIDDMVAKGYVERRADAQDGRAKRLVLTPRARRAMAQARRFHATFERQLSEQIGTQQAVALRAALEALAATSTQPPAASRLRPL